MERGREWFDVDEDLQIDLTHLVQVIGEAAARLSTELTDRYPAVPRRQVIGMRHRVVHGNLEIDLDILWHAADVDVPRLGRDIDRILAELPKPDR